MAKDDDDNIFLSHTAPKTPEEWLALKNGAHKGLMGWKIVGPFYRLYENRVAFAWAIVAIVVLSSAGVRTALADLASALGGFVP